MDVDGNYRNPDYKTAELMSEYVSVYNYMFNYQSNLTVAQNWYDSSLDRVPVHGDELLFLFDAELFGLQMTEKKDKAMSRTLIKYWTEFAKTGRPGGAQYDLPDWKPFGHNKEYMELSSPSPVMKSDFAPETMLLWQRLIWDERERKMN